MKDQPREIILDFIKYQCQNKLSDKTRDQTTDILKFLFPETFAKIETYHQGDGNGRSYCRVNWDRHVYLLIEFPFLGQAFNTYLRITVGTDYETNCYEFVSILSKVRYRLTYNGFFETIF